MRRHLQKSLFSGESDIEMVMYPLVLSTYHVKNIRIAPAFRPGTMKPSSFPPLPPSCRRRKGRGDSCLFFIPGLKAGAIQDRAKFFKPGVESTMYPLTIFFMSIILNMTVI
jgi:hypothetical protein